MVISLLYEEKGGIPIKIQRFSSCILLFVAVLILAAFPVSATGTADELYQMPAEAGLQLPDSAQEAAAVLREGMKRCENNISVSFYVDADSFDGTKKAADDLAAQVQALSLAHTGVPNEGDYLLGLLLYMEPTNVAFFRSGDGWQFNITYYCAYFSTAEQEAELDAEIERLVQLLDLNGNQTDYQKVTAIYNYICSNVRYDYEHKESENYPLMFTAYAAAVHKTSVCQGYATLFYRLALEAGVDSRYITGFAGENHAWNIVKLDGQYYYLDATWDEGMFQYGYFLKSALDFWDHEPDERYLTEEFQAAHPIAQQSYQHPNVNGVTEDGFVYYVNNGIAILTGYNGNAKDVVVPATLDGYPLLEVASCAFMHNYSITSITFSEGIQILNSEPIVGCDNLKSIHLPSTVDFTGSKDPDFRCNVVCGPSWCPSVETITVAVENPNVVVVDNVLYSKDMTILRYYPGGDPREVFEIPEGVISIGAYAFESSPTLKEVVMPDTVRMINFGAFQRCSNLEKINISNSCRLISQYVFSKTALESIHIPASVEWLFGGSFGIDCQLKTITVDPKNPYYYVEDGVLYATYVEGVNTDDCLIPGKWLVKYPAGIDATSFTVPEGTLGIEMHAFDSAASLTEIILPDSLHTIYSSVFSYCTGLTKMELPNNLKKIYANPFECCTNLVELEIPASVEFLSYYLVNSYGTPGLKQVVFLGDMPEMYFETFQWCDLDIYYPAGNTTYQDAIQMNTSSEQWSVGCGDNFDLAQMQIDYENVRWHESCASHQFVSKVLEPTCTTSGYTGQECTVCGLIEVTGEITPATGHDWVLDYVQQPSCEFSGVETYRCSICSEYVWEEFGSPIGHSYDENGNCTNPEHINGNSNEVVVVGLDAEGALMISMVFILPLPIILVCSALTKKSKKDTDPES